MKTYFCIIFLFEPSFYFSPAFTSLFLLSFFHGDTLNRIEGTYIYIERERERERVHIIYNIYNIVAAVPSLGISKHSHVHSGYFQLHFNEYL